MPERVEDLKPWPRDPVIGAQLIGHIMAGLVTGPTAMVFIKQDALGQGASLMAAQLIDVAENLAVGCMMRSAARAGQVAPEVRDLFRQTPPPGIFPPPYKAEP
jgi:hypothetical protein